MIVNKINIIIVRKILYFEVEKIFPTTFVFFSLIQNVFISSNYNTLHFCKTK